MSVLKEVSANMADRGKDGKNPPSTNSGKGKMTVVMFQFEGSDETLQDGFKVIGQALEKLIPTAPVYVPALPPTRNGQAALPAAQQQPEYIEAQTVEEDSRQEPAEQPPPGQNTVRNDRGAAPRQSPPSRILIGSAPHHSAPTRRNARQAITTKSSLLSAGGSESIGTRT